MTLIEQLENAAEPSRILDSLIGRSLETAPTEPFKTEAPFERLEGMYWVLGRKDSESGPKEERWSKCPPLYTTSIDAALTLVPKGATWDLCFDDYLIACVGVGTNTGKHDTAPAIALCIAALKARAAATNSKTAA